jgi:chromosomal replication initiator protein
MSDIRITELGAARGGAADKDNDGSKVALATADRSGPEAKGLMEARAQKVRAMLRARLGEDIYTSWFNSMEFQDFDGKTVRVSVPVKFLRNWIQSHYADDLLTCCTAEFKGVERVDVALRQPGAVAARNGSENATQEASGDGAAAASIGVRHFAPRLAQPALGRTQVGGF